MKLPRALLFVSALSLFTAGCETTGEHLFTYAAKGTVIQAERVVQQFLDGSRDPLPYGGPAIDPPLQKMFARFAELKTQLEAGTLGLTESGEVALRHPDTATPALRDLASAENSDRAALYAGMADAVGHGTSNLRSWLPYVGASFGAQWSQQAPFGWWLRNEQGEWQRKTP